ncbi:hypothetical protein TrST_g6099 [Triparma strigata]|uniref:Uncharacterized protein n=1 Tax=Triparma strigata TaxID=1606541 RepID=A0A9W7C2E0_9STRA|nr:hypothetical protein TrST_g6099 [Triparma strigata]
MKGSISQSSPQTLISKIVSFAMRLLPLAMTAAGMITSPCIPSMITDSIGAPATSELRRRGMLDLLPFRYSTASHSALRSSVSDQLGVDPERLGSLHEIEAEEGKPPRRRRRRLIMQQQARSNPAAMERLQAAYDLFVCSVLAPNLALEWCSSSSDSGSLTTLAYQSMPALRVSPPSTQAMGRRHNDAVYGHQPGQLNYWLPLSASFGDNTLWVEPTTCRSEVDNTPVPLEGDFGDCFRFYGNLDYHSTRPNNTSCTRVSLDFRIVPGAIYDDDYVGSRSDTGVQKYAVGTVKRKGFYKIAMRDSDTGEWRVKPKVVG